MPETVKSKKTHNISQPILSPDGEITAWIMCKTLAVVAEEMENLNLVSIARDIRRVQADTTAVIARSFLENGPEE
ncbi:MAG: hypothetical protein M3O22_01755 [Pseudomonadota bacterium]|nr:hypothetical protein [Pseudomonadota bacterium]